MWHVKEVYAVVCNRVHEHPGFCCSLSRQDTSEWKQLILEHSIVIIENSIVAKLS